MPKFPSYLATLLLGCAVSIAGAQDFSKVDEQARNTTHSDASSVEKLAGTLTGGYATEKEKVRALYVWIADNIRYDVKAIENEDLSPEERNAKQQPLKVLKTKRAVCDGYANLFGALCVASGLAAEKVTGYSRNSRGKISRTGHAWNIVRADGQWGLIDATWGAGVVDIEEGKYKEKFNEAFFFPKPEVMILDHFPNDPLFQLLNNPISYKDFTKPETTLALQVANMQQTEVRLPNHRDSLDHYVALDSSGKRLDGSARMLRFDPDNAYARYLICRIRYDEAQRAYDDFERDNNELAKKKTRLTPEILEKQNVQLRAMQTALEKTQVLCDQVSSGSQYYRYVQSLKQNVREGLTFSGNRLERNEQMIERMKK